MKRLFFLILISLFTTSVSARQWSTSGNNITNTNTGNVGIKVTNPVYPFQIGDGAYDFSGIGFIPNDFTNQYAIIKALKMGGYGIILRAESQNSGKGQSAVVLRSSNGTNVPSQVTLIGEQLDFRTGNDYHTLIDDGTPGTSAMFINYAGQVGIGTTSPGSFKLAVEGKIGAREVKVTLASWADYVFNKEYKLMSLASLEEFIKKNNHLPNIPSAQEVKENGGIDLGDMNRRLLEKIEELTLHVIELNKEVQQLKKENAASKK
jgi:hypothetical protein